MVQPQKWVKVCWNFLRKRYQAYNAIKLLFLLCSCLLKTCFSQKSYYTSVWSLYTCMWWVTMNRSLLKVIAIIGWFPNIHFFLVKYKNLQSYLSVIKYIFLDTIKNLRILSPSQHLPLVIQQILSSGFYDRPVIVYYPIILPLVCMSQKLSIWRVGGGRIVEQEFVPPGQVNQNDSLMWLVTFYRLKTLQDPREFQPISQQERMWVHWYTN